MKGMGIAARGEGKKAGPEEGRPFEDVFGYRARAQILKVLLQRGQTLQKNLLDQVPMASNYLHKHINVLKEAGL